MRRHRLPLTVALLASAFTAPAMAAVPFINASCPGGLDVHADEGGPVYVQGRETTLKRFNDRFAPVNLSDTVVRPVYSPAEATVSLDPHGSQYSLVVITFDREKQVPVKVMSYKDTYSFREKIDIEGLDHPKRMFDLTEGLIRRKYSNPEIQGVLGGNFIRVLTQIWAGMK